MTNVYVGERYVPIVAGPWQSDTAYEKLTIVTYQGSGFISKKDVPPNVLPTNTAYWALMYQGTGTGDVVTWDDILGNPNPTQLPGSKFPTFPQSFPQPGIRYQGSPAPTRQRGEKSRTNPNRSPLPGTVSAESPTRSPPPGEKSRGNRRTSLSPGTA